MRPRAGLVASVITLLVLVVLAVVSGCNSGGSNTTSQVQGGQIVAAQPTGTPVNEIAGLGTGAEQVPLIRLLQLPEWIPSAALIPPSPTPTPVGSPTPTPTPTPTPSSFFVTYDAYPPVGNQGDTNSCIAWSWGYGFTTAYANRATPANSQLPQYQVNQLYMYAQILKNESKSCTQGTADLDYLDFIEKNGAWPNSLQPTYPLANEPTPGKGVSSPALCEAIYQVDDATNPPLPSEFFKLPENGIAMLGRGAFNNNGSYQVVQNVKEALRESNLPVPIAVWLPVGIGTASTGQAVESQWFLRNSNDNCAWEGHGLLVVGYDDNKPASAVVKSPTPSCSGSPVTKPDWTPTPGPGAFLIQNSWGSLWGTQYPGPVPTGSTKPVTAGFVWVSYDTFYHILQNAAGVLPTSSFGPNVPLAVAKSASAAPSAALAGAWQYARVVDGVSRVYIIVPYVFGESVKITRVTLTTPKGATLVQNFEMRGRTGVLHFSRRDGRQWPAGDYTVALDFTTSGGVDLRGTATVKIGALGRGDLLPAEPPVEVLGTNGQPIQ